MFKMFNQLSSHYLLLVMIVFFFFSCARKNTDIANPPQGTMTSSDSQGRSGPDAGSNEPRRCQNSRVLRISDSGQNIISRLTSDKNIIVNWNVNSGKMVSDLNFPVNPYIVDPQGNYIIRRIDYRKYQLIRLTKHRENKSDFHYANKILTINAAYNPMPQLNFSADGQNIIFFYKTYSREYSHRLDIYNLAREKVISSITGRNISFAQVTRDSKYFLIGFREGYKNIFQKIDIETSEIQYEKVLNVFDSFSELYVGEHTFVLKGIKAYYFHNLFSGELLFIKKLKKIFDIGSEGEKALVSDAWNEIGIIELQTGKELIRHRGPQKLNLSTCQLVDSPLKLLCEDSFNQNQITIWNVEENSFSKKCF